MTTAPPAATEPAPPVDGDLPEIARLAPDQQMGITCARCRRRLGSSGRQLGTVPDRWGGTYLLWACAPRCPPRTVTRRPRTPAPPAA